jgi:alkylhydroperoxidase family enzyme
MFVPRHQRAAWQHHNGALPLRCDFILAVCVRHLKDDGMSVDVLNLRVVVRRVAVGTTPYKWEVVHDGPFDPVHVCSVRFRGMQEALEAGSAWLGTFIANEAASRRSRAASTAVREIGMDDDEIDDEDDDDEGLEAGCLH